MMDYKKFADDLRSQAGSYALFYGAPRGDLEKAADVIEELAERLEPSNEPLTLEELREMDGEPVWVVPLNDFDILPANYLVNAYAEQMVVDKFGDYLDFEACGKTWLAYRRRPEEGSSREEAHP